MILHEDATFDPMVTHARFAVLEAMDPTMKVHCYSTVDALAVTLDAVLDEMKRHTSRGWEMPHGLTRVALVFTDPRAMRVVASRMAPGCEFAAWPQPDAWLSLYQRIDDLRARAKAVDPQFVPRYL